MEVFSAVYAELERNWCAFLTKHHEEFKSTLDKRGYNVQLVDNQTSFSIHGTLKAITVAENVLKEFFVEKTTRERTSKLNSKTLTESRSYQENIPCNSLEARIPTVDNVRFNENSEKCIHIELLSHPEEDSSFHEYCTITLQEDIAQPKDVQDTEIGQSKKTRIPLILAPEPPKQHLKQPVEPSVSLPTEMPLGLTESQDNNSCSSDTAGETSIELDCSMCSYKTSQKNLLKRHMKTHFNEEQKTFTQLFSCSKCSYKTTRKVHYVRHIRAVHNDLRPYLCDLCGKTFKRQDNLKQHRLLHATPESYATNSAPFQCDICNKVCHSKAHLKEHQAVHSSARSFLCEICGASFKTLSVQRKHVNTLHRNPRSFACQVCKKRFNTNYALRRHMKQHPFEIELLDNENNDISTNQQEKHESTDEQSIDCA